MYLHCSNKCIGPADHTWPQSIGSGVVKIVLNGMRSHQSLIDLFDPLFEKLATSSWESVGMNHIWNPRRPIWLQSIIHLIEPHLVPAVKELITLVDSGRTWTISQVRDTFIQRFTQKFEKNMSIKVSA